MLVHEFWEVYNKHYKQFVSPSFCVVDHPLSGDTGYFLCSIYANEAGTFCVDRSIERSNTPHHREFESEEEAVKYMLGVCKFITGYRPEGI